MVSFKKDDPVVSGEFSLVSHIGALIPRFIYAPLEEVSYNLFSKLSSVPADIVNADEDETKGLIGEK